MSPEDGKGWSDNRIIEALETSPSMVYRVRKQLVEEGFEAVLSRKPRAMPAVARIFDGEKEAKLIALACSKPPKGRARWTLRLLENKVVELGIVDRASDSTIGRALKKTIFTPDYFSFVGCLWWLISFVAEWQSSLPQAARTRHSRRRARRRRFRSSSPTEKIPLSSVSSRAWTGRAATSPGLLPLRLSWIKSGCGSYANWFQWPLPSVCS